MESYVEALVSEIANTIFAARRSQDSEEWLLRMHLLWQRVDNNLGHESWKSPLNVLRVVIRSLGPSSAGHLVSREYAWNLSMNGVF